MDSLRMDQSGREGLSQRSRPLVTLFLIELSIRCASAK
jgi:hypothetical protein